VETAKTTGRPGFAADGSISSENIRRARVLLVEKTDRLYRNFKGLFDDLRRLGVEIHLVKENVILSRESRSHEKFNAWHQGF